VSFNPDKYNELTVTKAPIPGFYVIKLPVHGDNRGWFKENYQKEKMEALGLPAFEVVQNNFSFNDKRGATRGLHAEPWEKFISVANGSVFGAWVDLRKGPSFGTTFSIEINPGVAVFVPRGVANGYQTLEDNVTYTYLVNAHWSPETKYTFVNLFDPTIAINWPISKDMAIISEKDANHPFLNDVVPMEIEHE
jgi:dTDP-4-dehydrorhamnose 3,5-epimerase